MTFSIVARSDDGESWGVAVASKFLAVGSAVPAAVAGVGAIATQADANVSYKFLALAHLDDGRDRADRARPAARGGRQARPPPGRHRRRRGRSRHPHRGRPASPGPAASPARATRSRATSSPAPRWSRRWRPRGSRRPEAPLARRLIAALRRRRRRGRRLPAAGSRRRCWWSRTGPGTAACDDVAADLRVDDHADPVDRAGPAARPQRPLPHRHPPRTRRPTSTELCAELDERAQVRRAAPFAVWVGAENYEMPRRRRLDCHAGSIDELRSAIARRRADA